MAYSGNNAHKHLNNAIELDYQVSNDTAPARINTDFRRAQYIVHYENPDVDAAELRNLANRLLNSIVRSNCTDGRFMGNASNAVFAWNAEVKRSSIAPVRSFVVMQRLQPWQIQLSTLLWEFPETEKICFFQKNGDWYTWIVTSNPTTQMIYLYSQKYIEFVNNQNIDFDFVVYGRDEFPADHVPSETIILKRGE